MSKKTLKLKLAAAAFAVAAVATTQIGALAFDAPPLQWRATDVPREAVITGGPFTLEQGEPNPTDPANGYCTINSTNTAATVNTNPGTMRFQPEYFPFTTGSGMNLQGYFDYRVKDLDEAVLAASSSDGGRTWTFQSEALELSPGACPTSKKNPLFDPTQTFASTPNSYGGLVDDDGNGHPFVLTINGNTYLYTLDRSSTDYASGTNTNFGDSNGPNTPPYYGLVVTKLTPTQTNPLGGASADAVIGPVLAPTTVRTVGLLDPDGILDVVPNNWNNNGWNNNNNNTGTVTVLYLRKILGGANESTWTANNPSGQTYDLTYPTTKGLPCGTGAVFTNSDVTILRVATTTDGVNFTDLGPVYGLIDDPTITLTGTNTPPTSGVQPNVTRWVGPRGTIIPISEGRYGMFFSGGSCFDDDSDAFHYIGYAESDGDLFHWTVVNGINNPIASRPTVTATLLDGTTSVTFPSATPVIGPTLGWWRGRVYSPSLTPSGPDPFDYTMVFAGYFSQKPKNGLSDYRTITRVGLTAARAGFGGY